MKIEKLKEMVSVTQEASRLLSREQSHIPDRAKMIFAHFHTISVSLMDRLDIRADLKDLVPTVRLGEFYQAVRRIHDTSGISNQDSPELQKIINTITEILENTIIINSPPVDQNENQDTEEEKITSQQIPDDIIGGVEKFRKDYPFSQKTVFIMMKFGNTKSHDKIVEIIKNSFLKHDIIALRADDKEYLDDLFPNVKVYMYSCDFAIAIFDRITEDDFNPNVSLEVGFMFGMRKNVLLLKDKTLKNLPTDLTGKLYKEFDTLELETTIPDQIEKWLKDKAVI